MKYKIVLLLCSLVLLNIESSTQMDEILKIIKIGEPTTQSHEHLPKYREIIAGMHLVPQEPSSRERKEGVYLNGMSPDDKDDIKLRFRDSLTDPTKTIVNMYGEFSRKERNTLSKLLKEKTAPNAVQHQTDGCGPGKFLVEFTRNPSQPRSKNFFKGCTSCTTPKATD